MAVPHPLSTIVAASLVSVLLLGGLLWRPWPGWGWLAVAVSHAWLLESVTKSSKPHKAPPASVALATSCTVAAAGAHTTLGIGSALDLGWGMGLCVWLVCLQALAATLQPVTQA